MKYIGRKDTINNISDRARIAYDDASKAYWAIISTIKGNLNKSHGVHITGLGTFVVYYYKGRKGHNPRTGKPLTIKSHYYPYFKASSRLKRLVKSKSKD